MLCAIIQPTLEHLYFTTSNQTIMGRNDFLKKIEQDIQIYGDHYDMCIQAEKQIKLIEKPPGLKLKISKPNIIPIIKSAINDKDINYSLNDFFRSIESFSKSTDKFKIIAKDLQLLKNFVNSKKIEDETFVYIILHLYGSNFDNFINLLKPLSKAIQKHKKYTYTTSKGKIKQYGVNNSENILLVLELYEPKIKKSLNKIFNRKLRNKIAHEEYKNIKNKIFYDKKWIKKDTVFQIVVIFGYLINQFQKFEYEQRYKTYKNILKLKLTKSRIKSFLQTYNV